MKRTSLVMVLVEGDLDFRFLYHYLLRLGFKAHQVRPLKSAAGSGEQWVRGQVAVQVAACRARPADTHLIVMVDADLLTVQQRMRQLEEALREEGMAPIATQEPVVRLVPKRNVETWLLCLNGEAVTEEENYKQARTNWNQMIQPAVETLYWATRPKTVLPESFVPSLQTGVADLQRLSL